MAIETGSLRTDVLTVGTGVDTASLKTTEEVLKAHMQNIRNIVALQKLGGEVGAPIRDAFEDIKLGARNLERAIADVNRVEFLGKADKELSKYGVSLTDATGKTRMFSRISADLFALKEKIGVPAYTALIKKLHTMEINIDNSTDAYSRFKGELMSVMFFGMQVASMFQSMIAPAFELANTSNILSSIWGITFLPVALQVNDALFKFWGMMDNMPLLKEFIMAVALLGYTFGTLMFNIGMIGLGVTGFKDFKNTLTTINIGEEIGKISRSMSVMKVSFIESLLAMKASTLAFVSTWRAATLAVKIDMLLAFLPMIAIAALVILALRALYNNFEIFKEDLKRIIMDVMDIVWGVWLVISGVFKLITGAIIGLITGDFSIFLDGWKRLKQGILNIAVGILNIFYDLVNFIIDLILGMFDELSGFINWIANKLGKKNLISVDFLNRTGKIQPIVLVNPVVNTPTMNIPGLPSTATGTEKTTQDLINASKTNITNITINNDRPAFGNVSDMQRFANETTKIINQSMDSVGGVNSS